MAKWLYTVQLKDVLALKSSNEITEEKFIELIKLQLAKFNSHITALLKRTDKEEYQDMLFDLEELQDKLDTLIEDYKDDDSEFNTYADYWLTEMYDFSDKYRIWVK